jgi:hypothetical protein
MYITERFGAWQVGLDRQQNQYEFKCLCYAYLLRSDTGDWNDTLGPEKLVKRQPVS